MLSDFRNYSLPNTTGFASRFASRTGAKYCRPDRATREPQTAEQDFCPALHPRQRPQSPHALLRHLVSDLLTFGALAMEGHGERIRVVLRRKGGIRRSSSRVASAWRSCHLVHAASLW